MRSYRDFCRPAHPVERTIHLAKPGDVILGNACLPAERVPGQPNVVAMRRRKAVANV